MQRAGVLGFLVVVVAAVSVPVEARAGVVIATESAGPQAPAAKDAPKAKTQRPRYQGQLFVDGERVRMQGEAQGKDGATVGTVLFRAQPESFVFLNEGERTYVEMTRADAQRIGSAIETARSQMQAQLQKMSPEQRAAFEEAMAGVGGGLLTQASKPKKAVEPAKAVATGATDKVGSYACRGFDIVRGGKKIADACVASWADLGFSEADVAGLRKMAAFQRQLFAEVNFEGIESAPGSEAFEVMDQLKGFPVRVSTLVEGKEPLSMRVVKVERKDIDPKLFDVPKGYAKREMAAQQ